VAPPVRPSVPPKFPSEKYSSNITILKELQVLLANRNEVEIRKILDKKIVIEKLQLSIGYYDTQKNQAANA
jgi:hypothetical protein